MVGDSKFSSGVPGRKECAIEAKFSRANEPYASGPSVSVVVPTLNEEENVGDLLADLCSQTRTPAEIFVVDAGSSDETVRVAEGFPGARVLHGSPPVAEGRNLGGRASTGEIVVFLDADARIPDSFLENFVRKFEERDLDVACPVYRPGSSTRAVETFHAAMNALFKTFEGVLPSGAGHCIAVRGALFRGSRGFDPSLKFDDVEMVRRLSREGRFGILDEEVRVSDRRYREHGSTRMFLRYSLMALFFALGKFRWANAIDYEFGDHGRR
jgi:glycosyltransferase involved in cell wall biosynthesis